MKKILLVVSFLLILFSFTTARMSNSIVNVNVSSEKDSLNEAKKDTLIATDTTSEKEEKEEVFTKNGRVSWYGSNSHGRKTASGKKFDMNDLTAAHKTLPFGTKVKLRNPNNGKEVTITITDRGPFVKSREFDLSKAAFKQLGNLGKGTLNIVYKIIDSKTKK